MASLWAAYFFSMEIPWETIQNWQDAMAAQGLRGCLVCLHEALAQQYVPADAAVFSFSGFTCTCPRHNFQTFPAREFIIRFAAMLNAQAVLPLDCPDPARELQRIFLTLRQYYVSGAFHRLQRAHIPRRL